ncbi:hypothetical protein OPT61_g10326 [Boeremia exigua]|uniref:Uncharacterized protein n=1 Tax=Boeremia exigua TaxID=749465 RepID=A0ACC2HQK8_9PLEO|nr:hypothetical protein OPT61_g10326 [Boeremia exigua]
MGDYTNGTEPPLNRSEEVNDLLNAVQELIIPFIAAADRDADTKHTGHGLAVPGGAPRTALVEHHPPKKLESLLQDQLKIGDDVEKGKDRLLTLVDSVLKYSVNTWDQGFMVRSNHLTTSPVTNNTRTSSTPAPTLWASSPNCSSPCSTQM